MDSSQNWLGFSLSNSHHHIPSGASSPAATDLSILTGAAAAGPKLEDFLGGGGGGSAVSAALSVGPAGQYSVEALSDSEIYDSELKRIAAGFLRGLSADRARVDAGTGAQKQLTAVAAALSDTATKKAADTFGQRTSIFRGVTRHRWTGRYEAHLWDNSCRREGQSRKGRQVYLGGYDKEEKAARAYDLAALKYWGPSTTTNFPITNYEKELGEMKNMTRQEFVASLRRRSSGFSRGASIYRGVTRHHQHGRWQARIGRVAGNKDLYLGTFSTQEEAAEAYDIAAIKFRGLNAVTNFDMSRYDVKSIARSNLPVGGGGGISGGKPKTTSHDSSNISECHRSDDRGEFSSSVSSAVTYPTASALSLAPVVKPDAATAAATADYWAVFGGSPSYHSAPLNGAVSAPHHGQAPKPFFSLDFSAGCCNNATVSAPSGLLSCGGNSNYAQQQASGSSVVSTSPAVPYVMPHVGGGNGGAAGCEGGNWTTTTTMMPFHPFHASKPTVSVFQTPIFGME